MRHVRCTAARAMSTSLRTHAASCHSWIASLVLLAGCSSATDGPPVEPSFDSKADSFVDFSSAEDISFGDTVSGTFDQDFQFFIYRFDAAEGAALTAEVTHAGTSSSLNTTMYLYRLERGEDP